MAESGGVLLPGGGGVRTGRGRKVPDAGVCRSPGRGRGAAPRPRRFIEGRGGSLLRSLADERGTKLKWIAQALRVALTGKTVSPGIDEVMITLGKERVVQRLQRAIAQSRPAERGDRIQGIGAAGASETRRLQTGLLSRTKCFLTASSAGRYCAPEVP